MGYFRNIAEAASTIFEGLAITASHMLRKPITVQYPDRTLTPVTEQMAPRYRGFLKADMKICTACLLCQQACPINCIHIDVAKDATATPPQRLVNKFDIDIGLCMFCGLCTEVCPTGAIKFTREFTRATYDLKDLMFHFVEEGKPVAPYKKGAA